MPNNFIPKDINYFDHIINRYQDVLNGELKDVFLRYAIKEAFLITELLQSVCEDENDAKDMSNNIAILINSLYDIQHFNHNSYTELNTDDRNVLQEQMSSFLGLSSV